MKFSVEDCRKKLKDFALKRQVKHRSILAEPFLSFLILVMFADADNLTKEIVRTLGLILEINIASWNMASQNFFSETYDSNPEVIFKEMNDLNKTPVL